VSSRSRARVSARAPRVDAFAASWYARPAAEVAVDLIGAHIVSMIGGRKTVGRIVETEAYIGPHDAASHAAERIGRTGRNEAMYGTPGIAYIYRIYGIHWCLNIVTDRVDYPAAVLIRAAEPVQGIGIMRQRREAGQKHLPDTALASGPGRLAKALGLTADLDAHPLDRLPLYVTEGVRVPQTSISTGPRVGITRAADWPLRFWETGSRWVSRGA
jgi:DNA-3-methyladenine glycosylase